MTWAITKWYVSEQLQSFSTSFVCALWRIFLLARKRFVTVWFWAFTAFVNLGVCISKSDCDVSDSFLSESDSIDARDGSDNSWLSVCDVAYCTNVEGSLTTDDLRRQGMEGIDVFVGLVLEVLVVSVELFNLLLGKSFDIFHGDCLNEKK